MSPERLFADTNLFLRYLTNDIPQQADAVETLLRRAAAGEVTLLTAGISAAFPASQCFSRSAQAKACATPYRLKPVLLNPNVG